MDTLIADIYEAAVLPENWQSVLSRLSNEGDGALASIVVNSQDGLKWLGTPEANKLIDDYAALRKPDFNSRLARLLSNPHFGFLTDLDCFTAEELDADPFYQTFLRPRGYGWVAARHLQPPSGEMIFVSIERYYDRGPFEADVIAKLDRIGPHLARASLLASRSSLARVRAMADVLQSIGLAAAVLRPSGKILAANTLFEQLMPHTVQDRIGRMQLVNKNADRFFSESFQSKSMSANSIPVPATESRPAMIFHQLPICGSANDIFSNAMSLVVVTPVDRAAVPNAEVLQGLFDLTPAEARIAHGIGGANSIDELAVALGISRETVRTQLRQVLAKTGLSRQQELVGLLAGKALPDN